MDRIWLAGDTHGEIDLGKVVDYFEDLVLYDEVTKEDYLIILGDAGVCWDGGAGDSFVQEQLHGLPCTVLFIDGNHENFDLLSEYPDEEWHGGKVQYICEDVIHLMRGQVYEIGGRSFFTFGGGNSIDRSMRRTGISWWPEEMPSDLEYSEGLKNLERAGNRVDYILTHTCPGHVAHQLVTEIYSGEEQLQQYLDEISQSVEFEMWYFGHWHMDEIVEGRYVCLWNEIVELEE